MLQRGRGRGMSQSDDSSRPGGGRGRLASSSGMYKCIILQRTDTALLVRYFILLKVTFVLLYY